MTPVIQIQQSAFQDDRIGFAAALSMLVFVIVIIAIGIQKLVTKERSA